MHLVDMEAWGIRTGPRPPSSHSWRDRHLKKAAAGPLSSMSRPRIFCFTPWLSASPPCLWLPWLGAPSLLSPLGCSTCIMHPPLRCPPPRVLLGSPCPGHQPCIWLRSWGAASQPQSRTHWGRDQTGGRGEWTDQKSHPATLTCPMEPAPPCSRFWRHLCRVGGEGFYVNSLQTAKPFPP